MFKLILMFGVWINPWGIEKVSDLGKGCYVSTGYHNSYIFKNKTCDQVAQEINKQMEKMAND
tara:strand:- start:3251 stop:3436 length:186 start_codon:yes stop_codon:yes gene_type:complete